MEGALIIPSEEDNNTFSINFSTGEVYKVRAAEAKERQVWVDQLRACTNIQRVRTSSIRKKFERSVLLSPSSLHESFHRATPHPADVFHTVDEEWPCENFHEESLETVVQ